jgi:hypothetical protein
MNVAKNVMECKWTVTWIATKHKILSSNDDEEDAWQSRSYHTELEKIRQSTTALPETSSSSPSTTSATTWWPEDGRILRAMGVWQAPENSSPTKSYL